MMALSRLTRELGRLVIDVKSFRRFVRLFRVDDALGLCRIDRVKQPVEHDHVLTGEYCAADALYPDAFDVVDVAARRPVLHNHAATRLAPVSCRRLNRAELQA